MTNKEKQEEIDILEENIIIEAEDSENIDELIPSMNLNIPKKNEEEPNLIGDNVLLSIYEEILNNIRADRQEVDELVKSFADMVINSGDATSASKEALVQLVKTKTDTADKMAKIADLMTRIKLKEKDTFPKYLSAAQNNTINIGESNSKRALLDAIHKARKNES